MQIATYLDEVDVTYEYLPHPPSYTASHRAKCLHVPGRQVAKCVLLRGPDELVLAILPATDHVDTDRLSELLGGPVRLANDAELADTFRDCEWGVVPPFAQLYGIPAVLDASIDPETLLVFEGQTHFEAIRLRCRDFERLERPRRLAFAAP